jgi:polar amino acid transport system permease protein
VTFEVTLAGIIGALVVGTIGASMRTSKSALARGLATAFAEFFRNTPPLVHIYFAVFALPLIGISFPSVVCATIALILYQGAINVEILRAGLEAVPKGQYEAASALGLSPLAQFRDIIFPQAFRISLPALGNNQISLLKNTSLISAIGTFEITGRVQDIISIRFSSAELYLTIGAFYLVSVFILSAILRITESRLAKYAA